MRPQLRPRAATAKQFPAPSGVSVAADADAPTLDLDSNVAGDQTTGAEAGTEDQAIDLDIASALTDTDGSEALSITIGGVPTGAILTNTAGDIFSGGTSFTLTADQLAGLQITPPPNSDVDFQLTVDATSTEAAGGDSETVSGTISVSVAADADAPTLDLDSNVAGDQTTGAAAGTEDQAIDLDIASALTDTDGSETLSIEIAGVPAGATLNYGTFDPATGNWTLTSADLNGLRVTPAPNSGADFQLTVSATSTEANGGDSETVTGTIDVVVTADADAPDLSAPDVITIGDPSAGDETITGTSGDDTLIGGGGDDTISGLQGDDVIYGDDPDDSGATVDGDGNLVAPLDITSSLNDLDGSETLSIAITGVPADATLNHGTFDPATGIWTLDEADLADLEITVPPGSEDFQLTVDATATDTDPDTGAIDTETTSTTITVDITGGGAAGSDTISGGQGDDTIYGGAGDDEIDGDQGADIIDGGSGADTISGGQGDDIIDGGAGADTLSGGQGDDILDGGAGADTLSGGQGDDTAIFTVGESDGGIDEYDGGSGTDTLVVNLSEEDLNNPEIVAELLEMREFIAEGGNGSATFPTLGIEIKDFEDVQFQIDGNPIDLDAAAPTLDLDSTAEGDQSVGAAAGDEDQAIDLDISAALTDTDGSETLSIEISGVPTGATLNNGTFDPTTGNWMLAPGDLADLQITPAADSYQ